jgi:hypothetical protein
LQMYAWLMQINSHAASKYSDEVYRSLRVSIKRY